jgi:hypothetical protein
MTNWLKFTAQQIVQLAATVAGFVILVPFCAFKLWVPSPHPSIRDGKPIDQWAWGPLNYVYGNPEDGVSGVHAGYMPTANSRWRAYCWSALRNSCDNLKYVFAAPTPDYRIGTYTVFGKKQQWMFGWKPENGFNVPVCHFWGTPWVAP